MKEATSRHDAAAAADPRFGTFPVVADERADGTIIVRATVPLGEYPARHHDSLFHWARKQPARAFLAERRPGYDGWATIDYGEAAQKAERIAAALAERNLDVERPILILSGNSIDHQLLALGAMIAGIPFSPISTAYSLVSQDFGKLKHVLALLDPGLVYAADERYAKALSTPEMGGREIVLSEPSATLPRATPFPKLLEGGSPDRLKTAAAKVGLDTIAKFLFTSGSTGVPKGVITTHRMINANQQMLTHPWHFFDLRPPVLVDWLPWSHVFGGNCNMGQILRAGGTLYIDDGRPIPGEVARSFRNLREISPTVYFNVPRGFDLLLSELRKDEDLRKRFFAELDVMFYAGAALPDHLWSAFAELAEQARPGQPASMISGWGLTETAPAALILNRHAAEVGNLGPPCPGVEFKLVPNANKLEARVRGPSVTPGYWKMPELTAKAFDEEGFFITGDAVKFVDRNDPARGFRFDGRVVEDFKLMTGTWVHTGDLRSRALKALAGLVFDVVVVGADREEVGLLVFPAPSANADAADYRDRLRAGIERLNDGIEASSQRVARALVLREPPSLDRGEITDKGSLNMRAILDHRRALVEKLYNNDADVIRPA
jgi:feruloyl-CoA synthase